MLKLRTGFEEPQPETTPALEPNMTNPVTTGFQESQLQVDQQLRLSLQCLEKTCTRMATKHVDIQIHKDINTYVDMSLTIYIHAYI